MKTIILALCFILSSASLSAQHLLTDTAALFHKQYELSGLTISENKLYMIAEKCGNLFAGSYNYYADMGTLSTYSPLFTDCQLEGICFYNNPLMFVCDEKNTRVMAVDIARKTAAEVKTNIDLSAWTDNMGMEGIAVDKERQLLFLARENNGKSFSEICVFDIRVNNNIFSLEIKDSIFIQHSNEKCRYTDMFFDEQKQQLILSRSFYSGKCNTDNKYMIDTISTARLNNRERKNGPVMLNSDSLILQNISALVNGYCSSHETNIEGIAADTRYIYLLSDNALSQSSHCEEPGKHALFIRINRRP